MLNNAQLMMHAFYCQLWVNSSCYNVTEVQSYVMFIKLSITLLKTNVITQFHSIKVFLIGYLRNIYRIQSNTVYIKTHSSRASIYTHWHLCTLCSGLVDLLSSTNHLNNLKDHSDQYNRCFNVYLVSHYRCHNWIRRK